jgi:hypothetical protein
MTFKWSLNIKRVTGVFRRALRLYHNAATPNRIPHFAWPTWSDTSMPSASLNPLRRYRGDDQGRQSQVRLVVACLGTRRKELTGPAIGAGEGKFGAWRRRVNQPDDGQQVVRTT